MTNTRIQKVLSFPLSRIVISMVILFVPLAVVNKGVLKPLLGLLPLSEEIARLIRFAILTPLFLYAYNLYFGYFEKRKVTEWSLSGMWRESTIGFVLAFTALAIPVLILKVLGFYEIQSVSVPYLKIFYPLFYLFFLALTEEYFFRGIVYRILEEKVGTYIALTGSAMLFTIMHLTNDYTTIWSTISVFIGGILMGACFRISGRLWLPSFAHLGWNFAQVFLGLNVSGIEKLGEYAPFVTTSHGSELITGGGFGPEGSIIVILSNTCISILLIMILYRKNLIINPSWKSKDQVIKTEDE